ncbi:hypothetical protein [Thermospira aquatica]|uniref:Glycosyltransferase n=1 Tax=Thermospira aquatica TaxID=2828656 RepID=A0AAX3BBY5_9SPIR|nr:hypothetical protein [Thermospira aquatica]URA09641.1 hypothetical protein KDW03_09125 [Thermospira aquatica]
MIPVYSEISNRDRDFLKIPKEISVVLYLRPLAHPVDTLNSLYALLRGHDDRELILIAEEKDAYQYDSLMERFPVLRVIFPEESLSFSQVVRIGCEESFSRMVVFLDDLVRMETLPGEIFSLYFDEPQCGMIVPQWVSEQGENIASQLKLQEKNGFFSTFLEDRIQNALSVFSPLSFCFAIDKEKFLSGSFEIWEYDNPLYTYAELGWRMWKQGLRVIHVRQWKTFFEIERKGEMAFSDEDEEYLLFHVRNISDRKLVKKQQRLLFSLFLRDFLSFRWKQAQKFWYFFQSRKKFSEEMASFPLEDLEILSIINNEKA